MFYCYGLNWSIWLPSVFTRLSIELINSQCTKESLFVVTITSPTLVCTLLVAALNLFAYCWSGEAFNFHETIDVVCVHTPSNIERWQRSDIGHNKQYAIMAIMPLLTSQSIFGLCFTAFHLFISFFFLLLLFLFFIFLEENQYSKRLI